PILPPAPIAAPIPAPPPSLNLHHYRSKSSLMTTPRSVTHATFVIERTYPATPARVFAAFADPAIKSRWFGSPDSHTSDHALDFRVGGREIVRGGRPDGPIYTYEAEYQDLVPDQRIVSTYAMDMGD